MDESMKRSSTTGLESLSRSTASVPRGATSIHRSTTTTNLEKATRIRLFRNGDRHFAGKNVVLDRRAQDMDHLLDFLSTKITHQSYALANFINPHPPTSNVAHYAATFSVPRRTRLLIGFLICLLSWPAADACRCSGSTPRRADTKSRAYLT